MITRRCGCCATEHPEYDGVQSQGTCVRIEVFHADRGGSVFWICHVCSTTIVAAWAHVHAPVRASEVERTRETERP
jgi:hypothetical protein